MRVRREHGLQPSKCRASDAPAALAHIVWRAEDDGDALVHVLRHQVHDARLACGREAARLLDEVGHGRGLIQQPDLAWCGRGKGRTVRIRIRSRAKAGARARAGARGEGRARARVKGGGGGGSEGEAVGEGEGEGRGRGGRAKVRGEGEGEGGERG